MEKLRIVFMGTPDFAVGILDEILMNGHEVVGVVTAADKPSGRGQKVNYTAVKTFAIDKGLNLLQPKNLKDPEFIATLEALNANIHVVVAFRMLPEIVWRMPSLGTFNLHASLLPDYRGAAPINWAIINGETRTGVTTFFIDDKIDTGAMILSDSLEIGPEENAGSLHDRLMELGKKTVIKTLNLIESKQVVTQLQEDTSRLKTAHKLDKDNCKINWNLPGRQIYNQIRGLSPYPTAWTWIDEGDENPIAVKIFEAHFISEHHQMTVGTVICEKKSIKICLLDGYLEILSLQLPGKKRLKATEFLNGSHFNSNAKAS
jgi:methionyl-tRNA formyltransferase